MSIEIELRSDKTDEIKMKVFLIYPNSGSQVGFNYGLTQIASVLKAAGHQVRFWQLCEDLEPLPDKNEFIARIQEEAPDLLAFSVVTNQWPYTMQLAQWGRKELSIPQVCGGIHTLLNAEEILRTGLFDYVFRGECEEAFAEFVEKLSQNEPIDTLRNLAYIQEGRVIINPVRPLPILETLPFKDYELMDFQKLIDAKNGWVGIISSRGCPFSCTYCFNHSMVSAYRHDLQCSFAELNYIRHFRVDQIIQDIVLYVYLALGAFNLVIQAPIQVFRIIPDPQFGGTAEERPQHSIQRNHGVLDIISQRISNDAFSHAENLFAYAGEISQPFGLLLAGPEQRLRVEHIRAVLVVEIFEGSARLNGHLSCDEMKPDLS